MASANSTSLRLLEDCLFRNDDDAWRAFLTKHEDLWKSLCADVEWRLWLPGWLVARRRLSHAWKAVERFRQDRVNAADDEVEAYLLNYLRDVFGSGVVEYRREHRRPWSPDEWQWREPPAPEVFILDESMGQVESWLREEPLSRRVPFRLRHYRALAPLGQDERSWLAEQARISPDFLDQHIREEDAAHPGHQFPLSSRFIGNLMGISTDLVDQRVRQVLLRLRQRVTEGEQP